MAHEQLKFRNCTKILRENYAFATCPTVTRLKEFLNKASDIGV